MNIEFENSVEFDLFQSDLINSFLENYDILDLLYQSKRSAVYKIKSKVDNDFYTLKALKIEPGIDYDLSRICHLNHPGMAKIVGFTVTDKYTYVIKPYIKGKTLLEYVRQKGPLDEKEVKAITKQILEVFDYFHSQSNPLIYRDLKPANVMIDQNGKVILIDIETMRKVESSRLSDTFYVGTHGYASPEQYGFRQSDERSDIYSLGATLYFLLTGLEPVVDALQYRPIKLINPNISSRMVYIVSKCMAFNPEERFKSSHHIRKALSKRAGFFPFKSKMLKILLVFFASLTLIIMSVRYMVHSITLNIVNSLNEEEQFIFEPDHIAPSDHFVEPIIKDQISEEIKEDVDEEIVEEIIKNEETLPLVQVKDQKVEIDKMEEVNIAKEEPSIFHETIEIIETSDAIEPEAIGGIDPDPPEEKPLREVDYKAYQDAHDIVLDHIANISNGISIESNDKHPYYKITANRNLLPESVRNFKYMSVFSVVDEPSDQSIQKMIYSGGEKNHGLQHYIDESGFFSVLIGNGYLVILYDQDYFCVGYQYFHKSAFAPNQ